MLILTMSQSRRLVQDYPEAAYFVSAICVVSDINPQLTDDELTVLIVSLKGRNAKDHSCSLDFIRAAIGLNIPNYVELLNSLVIKNVIQYREADDSIVVSDLDKSYNSEANGAFLNLFIAGFKLSLFNEAKRLLEEKRAPQDQAMQASASMFKIPAPVNRQNASAAASNEYLPDHDDYTPDEAKPEIKRRKR